MLSNKTSSYGLEKFSFDYQLDHEGLFSDLVAIEAYTQASKNLVISPDWREKLDKLNRVRAVHGTTALEGNPLSEAEVSHQIDSLEGDQGDANKITKEQLQIRNAGKAQSWVRKRFHPGSSPLKLGDILKMHKMITEQSDTVNNLPGKLRTFPVRVGTPDTGGVHLGAPHEKLPKLMERYIDFINSRKLKDTHPVITALLSHFFLVTIHPFGDGNGRVSRLVEAGILFESGYKVHGFYGLSNYFYRNERDYKMLLQKCRKKQPFDVTLFIRFGVTGFAEELKGINNFLKAKINRLIYREMLVRAFNKRTRVRRRLLNQREYNLLNFLLSETEPIDPFSDKPSRKITFSELQQAPYVQSAYRDVTRRTFYRELLRLGEMGFIHFSKDDASKEWITELDFGAVTQY